MYDILLEIIIQIFSKTDQASYDVIGELDGYVDMGSPVPSDVGKRPHPPLVIGTRLHPLLHLLYIIIIH